MLKFIGSGSAFNTQFGNTSAFIKKKDSLVLIDSGGTVFHRLQELQLLDNLKKIYIIITHTHPDHVGSLGDIILYSYYLLGIKPIVYFQKKELIENFLSCIGVSSNMYLLDNSNRVNILDEDFGEVSIEFLLVSHVDTIPAYGFVMKQREGAFYYSGDANGIGDEILKRLSQGEFDRFYQDTCGLDYEGNAHMSLRKLREIIHPNLRSKIYCMHLDNKIDRQEVIGQGFNIVENEKRDS
ncbi:MAG: MBL fold metallo-hydrolase [Sporomusaceae bacterium]|nr:MBL fold metallo-hydrolase [Sporomusaceae bacterium]